MEAAPETGRSLSWQRTVKVVAITQAVTLIGFNFSYPFLPLFIQELGVTDRAELTFWTGLAIGGSGLAMAFASPFWGSSPIASAARRCTCGRSAPGRSCWGSRRSS